MDIIREQYKQLVSEQIGLPVSFLRLSWKGNYSPETHFFEVKGGHLESKWVYEPELLEKIMSGYLFWFMVSDSLKPVFWKIIFEHYLRTPDFAKAPMSFRVWIFLKRFPIPPYNLQTILRETGIPAVSL